MAFKYALKNVLGDPFWLTTMPMALVGWAVALVGSILNSSLDSSHFPIFSWWGLAFEMIAILLTLHVAFSHQIRMYRQAILVFLAVATIYTTNSTNNFVWRDNSSSGTAAAGNILLSIINFVWMLYFGTTQDEPIHMYIDSFSMAKQMTPSPAMVRRRMREKQAAELTERGLPGGRSRNVRQTLDSRLGTSSQPYRMSDIPQNLPVGAQTDLNEVLESGVPGDAATNSSFQQTDHGSNPLHSTYLYSMGQLNRHGLSSHEVASDTQTRASQRLSMGTMMQTEGEEGHGGEEDGYDFSHTIARAKARFSYHARLSDGELPFQEGEILDVCDMTGNWWYCKRTNGDVGICPRNYLEVLDEALL